MAIISPSDGVSIPAMHRSVMLFPHPDAPKMPIRSDCPANLTFSVKSPNVFFISTVIPIMPPHQRLTFFIALPDTKFITQTAEKAITSTTATQTPAVW